ncbi:MAG: chemotaxis protein CheA [Deltaproteobacteria bacterium]|nr:chemotaxis protein CheA [Deltaproteobacteria bacterium]
MTNFKIQIPMHEKTTTKEALKEFLVEAEDLLEVMNSELLKLGQGISTGNVDPGLLNSIFRSAHTMKGISGMFGFTQATNLTHTLEDMLDGLRMGRFPLTQGVVDLLFEGLEVLKHLVETRGKGEEIDIGRVEGFTEKMKQSLSSGQTPESPLQTLGIDKDIISVLTEYEEHRLKENIKQGNNLFLIGVELAITSFDEGLAGLTDRLRIIGEVIATLPSSGVGKDTLHFDILLGTKKDEAYLRENMGHLKVMAIKAQPPAQGVSQPSQEGFTLRGVSNTVRVDIERLDNIMQIVGELSLLKASISNVTERLRLEAGFSSLAIELLKVDKDLGKRLKELQTSVLDVRMVPINQLFERFPGVVRRLSKDMGKEITLVASGGDTRLDKLIIEELADPLMHLIRNALGHGIEVPEERERAGKPGAGTVLLQAMQRGNHVVIEVKDDGRGIDIEKVRTIAVEKGFVDEDTSRGLTKEEILDFIFLPGFSTIEGVSEISGRGVGMDVAKRNISLVGGTINVETEEGKGTKVIITLPITLAIIQALIAGLDVPGGSRYYAIPVHSILEVRVLQPSDIKTVEKREVISLRGKILPILRLAHFFGLTPSLPPDASGGSEGVRSSICIVVGLAESRLGLLVDTLHGQQDIVIRPLGGLKAVPGVMGATNLGEKGTILVLDAGGIISLTLKSVEKGYKVA